MNTQELRVVARRSVAQGIDEYTLADANGSLLPGFEAGAHVDLHLQPRLARSYSLINPSGAQPVDRYVLAVALAANSRGGSAHVHAELHVGSVLTVGTPRNLFALVDDAAPVVLIAGGIGVTPILAMARQRAAQRRSSRIVYAARSRAAAAYVAELQAQEPAAEFHFDDEHQGRPLDVKAVLEDLDPSAHVYCCGPAPLMDAVRQAALAQGHPAPHLHFESFGGAASVEAAPVSTTDAAADAQATAASGTPATLGFEVGLSRQGRSVPVAPGQSILDALEDAGVIVPSVCREGHCGSCECIVVEGEVDHRDQILSEAERQAGKSMMVCVSRAKGQRIVLDL